jgi:hypothetical protein
MMPLLPDGTLTAFLRTDKTSYRISEKITLEVSLTNTSGRDVWVYRHTVWPHANITVVVNPFPWTGEARFVDHWTFPLRSRNDLIRLVPKQSLRMTQTEVVSEFGIATGGEYEFTAHYRSPLPEGLSYLQPEFDVSFWSSAQKPVVSNTVKLSFRE